MGLLWLLAANLSSPAPAEDSYRDHFRAGRLDRAHAVLAEALEKDPDNSELRAWFAATLYRRYERDSAIAQADTAVKLNRCQALAHQTLAELYNPQMGPEKDRSYDKVWRHAWTAAECDPGFGPVWITIWNESARRGDSRFELEALKGLHLSNMFTPAAREFAGWLLNSLPKHAILITNGDLDTYPLWTEQVIQFKRQDVRVVNYALLNSDWYPQYVHDKYGLPIPDDEDYPESETWAEQSVLLWMDNPNLGPVALSVTLEAPALMGREDLQLRGSYYLTGVHEGPRINSEAVINGLENVNLGKMKGPMASDQDVSPVRISGADDIKNNMLYAALQCGLQLAEEGRTADALDILAWAEKLNEHTPPMDGFDNAAGWIRQQSGETR